MTDKPTILLIDDDANNVRILETDLEDDYTILTAEDGVKGWDVLQKNKDKIQVILLDRMMPNMNGIQFMHKLKADEEVKDIPVIMQTAAAEKEQIIEGIQAGVYYYLTKPYEKNVMLSIVAAALRYYMEYLNLCQGLKGSESMPDLEKDRTFEIKTLDEVKHLTTFVSQLFPEPERVVFGIVELLTNAVEHGNLGITYDEKTQLRNDGKWEDEIEVRQDLPENADKFVKVSYVREADKVVLTIEDQGKGFDWKDYMEISPERATHNHGRGIAISKMVCFDHLVYMGAGNKVVCTVNLTQHNE
jgi:CheY-like chemotaxis protein/anti-sigma regulatory factor (Ser/Thr protein kinase)